MNGLGDAAQALYEMVFADSRLAGAGLAVGVDIDMAGDDQSHVALGELPEKLHLAFGGRPVLFGHEIMGCGTDKPVGDSDIAYVDRHEKYRLFSVYFHSGILNNPNNWIFYF
jgi:hypothetical protein